MKTTVQQVMDRAGARFGVTPDTVGQPVGVRMIAGVKARLAYIEAFYARKGAPQWTSERLQDKAVCEWLLTVLRPESQPSDVVNGAASVTAMREAAVPTPVATPTPDQAPGGKAGAAVLVGAALIGAWFLFRRS